MKTIIRRNFVTALALAALATLGANSASAAVGYSVTVNTTAVSGTSGFLDFQFNPGNATSQAATAQVLNFSCAGAGCGVTGVPAINGSVVGTLPGPVTFMNTTALNEYFQGFNYGTSFSFVLVLSGPAIDAPNGTATAGTTFGLGLYDMNQNPILTNQGAGSGFAGQVDINLNGTTTPTAFPSSPAGAPTVVTFGPLVIATPLLTKTFGAASINIGGSTNLTFMLMNPNGFALTNVSFTDTLPAGLIISTPNGLIGTCGGGTITATAGSSVISLTGATLPAGATCTFSVSVTSKTAGTKVNTTSTVTSMEAAPGAPATATLVVLPILETGGAYQLRYIANLDKGDSYVNLTNAGTLDGRAPVGNICVNVYTFDPAEELISCCACPITPNGLVSLSARNDLISNTLTPGVPTSITVKLVSSAVFGIGANAGTNISATACDASGVGSGLIGPPNTGNIITRGMRAWATTLHLNTAVLPAPGVYQKTETPFSVAELSPSELLKLTSFCGFIQANGSGFGICKACRFGALGGELK